ncbi:hypothetical protein HELRODRAFT_185816 [Helobdella robusta]|uniref:Alanine--glyoxylate aminotransferase 2, mitochondrial n=1 Tax=Helobdella robusta TaxID=6412 RepID=T1FNB9_HELRO|nr:hypothetical protein HELRODRAFT_185816 [Helobdella robusta]ESN99588.1 hypothetical protein HELRODRAFT_185816 [Helobdella robusta]
MPACDFKPRPYTGPSYEDALKARRDFFNPGLVTAFGRPLLLHQGYMQWLWDQSGKRYLDMAAGIVTVSVGHCHPKTVKALAEQNITLWHAPSIFLSEAAITYATKLASKLPGNLKSVYLTNSGTEANDLALHMARLYTGRFDIISLQNAYHGGSPHLMGTTAMNTWKHSVPGGFGGHQTVVPDVYRGPWGGSKCRDSIVQTTRNCNCKDGCCEANERYLEQLENTLKFSIPKVGPAAFIAESIQGAGGVVQFPKDYLKKAFQMIRAKGGLCISDEVQTGFTRTGSHFWGFEAHGVVPDIVTMAKGIGNGFPLAAVVTTHEIAKPLSSALHFNTFGGDPLACAVGSAVLDTLESEKCMENSDEVGSHLLRELQKLRDSNKFVGDVRGKGLMVGLEMVQNKETKEPLPLEKVNAVWNEILDLGVVLTKGGISGNVFRLKPPLCITKDDVNFAVSVITKAINKHLK